MQKHIKHSCFIYFTHIQIYVNNWGDYHLVGVGGGAGMGRGVVCGVRGVGHPSLLFKFRATNVLATR